MMQTAENFIVVKSMWEWGVCGEYLFYSLRLRGHSTQVELFVLPLCVEIAVRFPEQRRAPRSTLRQKFLSIKKVDTFPAPIDERAFAPALSPRCSLPSCGPKEPSIRPATSEILNYTLESEKVG
jgi:hypothetical protein